MSVELIRNAELRKRLTKLLPTVYCLLPFTIFLFFLKIAGNRIDYLLSLG